jgi:hypothetical protein
LKPFNPTIVHVTLNAGVMMRMWKLTPTDTADPIWKKWSPEPIIVRAESEREARHLAVSKTIKTFPAIPYAPIPVNPWGGYPKIGDPSPTFCEDITNQSAEYSVDGSPAVLCHGEKF